MDDELKADKVKALLECFKKKYEEALDRLNEDTCEEMSLADLGALAMFYVMLEGDGSWKWPT